MDTITYPISIFFDEKANEEQKEALHMNFSGKAGGFMAELQNSLKFEEPNMHR